MRNSNSLDSIIDTIRYDTPILNKKWQSLVYRMKNSWTILWWRSQQKDCLSEEKAKGECMSSVTLLWHFALVTLTLTRWPWHINYQFDLDILISTSPPKLKFLGQGFQRFWHERTDRYTVYRHIDIRADRQTKPKALPSASASGNNVAITSRYRRPRRWFDFNFLT